MKLTSERLTSFEVLREHCTEVGECWIWQGRVSSRSRTPVISHGRSDTTVRKLILNMLGKQAKSGTRASCTCGEKQCVNPAHLITETYSTQIKRARAEHPAAFNAAQAKIARTLRSRSSIGMTEEKARAIRASKGEGTLRERAVRHGTPVDLICRIDNNKAWREFTTPFTGLGAR